MRIRYKHYGKQCPECRESELEMKFSWWRYFFSFGPNVIIGPPEKIKCDNCGHEEAMDEFVLLSYLPLKHNVNYSYVLIILVSQVVFYFFLFYYLISTSTDRLRFPDMNVVLPIILLSTLLIIVLVYGINKEYLREWGKSHAPHLVARIIGLFLILASTFGIYSFTTGKVHAWPEGIIWRYVGVLLNVTFGVIRMYMVITGKYGIGANQQESP